MGRPRVKVEQGKKYNHLTALCFSHIDEKGHQMWLCECDCENHTRKIIRASYLVSGHTTSCGCQKNKQPNYKHGMCYDRLYGIHQKMISRCYKTYEKSYKNYGGRGIKVCDEWRNSFVAFAEWAKSNGYQEDLTIDRINVNGDYSPDNCRWVNMKIQQNNRRNNHLILFNGEIHTLSEWQDITGISEDNIYARLKLGWSVEKALTETVKSPKRKDYKNEQNNANKCEIRA